MRIVKYISKPGPIEIQVWDNMIRSGKVSGNQHNPPKMFGANLSFIN